ncbi:MAG: anaerobic ribonucleoside-triphosphate reductase, partial [Candidatus Aenigmatarchaeota archaeon]
DLAKISLEIKRKVIEDFTEKGLYPYSKVYLEGVKQARGQYWINHFSTIGVIGMNEMCINFLGKPIYDPDAKAFAIKVLQFIREKITQFQEETGNLYNLEATPAEGTSYRLAKIDKKKFPQIKTAGTESSPYYTNSCHLPVSYTDDIFEILNHQDDLQVLFTGGTVVHLFVGEEIWDKKIVKELIKTVVENYRIPYFSITPTFSICPVHGYLPGKHEFCPYEHSEENYSKYGIEVNSRKQIPCEVYSRVVGYFRPVQHWNPGKQQEFKERKTIKLT